MTIETATITVPKIRDNDGQPTQFEHRGGGPSPPDEAMSTTIKGRTYTLTENTQELPALRANMISRGFDGTIWNGVSPRAGRQRRDIHAMFWRSAKTGEFVLMAGV